MKQKSSVINPFEIAVSLLTPRGYSSQFLTLPFLLIDYHRNPGLAYRTKQYDSGHKKQQLSARPVHAQNSSVAVLQRGRH